MLDWLDTSKRLLFILFGKTFISGFSGGQMVLRVKIWDQIWVEWKPVLDRLGAWATFGTRQISGLSAWFNVSLPGFTS